MSDPIDLDLIASFDEYFADTVSQDVLDTVESSGDIAALWDAANDLDLPGIGIEESLGGAGGDLAQVVAVAIAAGRHVVPLPLIEHHVAGWLLTRAGHKTGSGPLTVAIAADTDTARLDGGRLTGTIDRVPWAAQATHIVVLLGDDSLVVVDPAAVTLNHGSDIGGQPVSSLTAADAPVENLTGSTGRADILARYILLRSAQIVGALQKLTSRTVTYVRERHQFGQPIGAFQAVQEHVVTTEQAATICAGALARATTAVIDGNGTFEADALRVLTADHAGLAVRAAHQAHGAIGMTRELWLHHHTRRLNAWRWDITAPSDAAARIGQLALDTGTLTSLFTAPAGALTTQETPA